MLNNLAYVAKQEDVEFSLVRIASHCLFDGWIIQGKGSRYIIGYSNKSKVLAREFSNAVKFVTGKRPYQRERTNAIEIEFGNKALFIRLLELITLDKYFSGDFYERLVKNEEWMAAVLRTFWDDEGTVGFYRSKSGMTRKLRARCQNRKLREQLLKMHHLLGICAHEEYDKKGVIITDRKSIETFFSKISFTLGVKVVKINGYKPVWKNSTKSHVLRLLVKSYK